MLAFTSIASKAFIKSYFYRGRPEQKVVVVIELFRNDDESFGPVFLPCGSTVIESTLNLILLPDVSVVLFFRYFPEYSGIHYFLGFPEISLTILRDNF